MTFWQAQALTISCGLLVLATGCGPSGPDISGQVLLDGQPLAQARVSFYSLAVPGASYTRATCNDQGRFQIEPNAENKTLDPGKYAVTVSLKKTADGQIPVDYEMEELGGTLVESVPAKYTNYTSADQVELSADIKPGKNDLKFELKSQ